MALRELPLRTASAFCSHVRPVAQLVRPSFRRNSSSEALYGIEPWSPFSVPPPSEELSKTFDPVARSKLRRRGKRELPPSRYISFNGIREQVLTFLQIPVPPAQVLPRPSSSPPASASVRSLIASLSAWSF